MNKICIMVCISLSLIGCGKTGPLLPPEALVPATITNLHLEQKGAQFLVSWPRPSTEVGGRSLKDLAGFRLYKREVLPSGEDCEECPTAYRMVKSVDLEYPEGIALAGNKYIFTDDDVAEGKTYRYKVLSYKKDGSISRPSNKAGRKKVAPPVPPVIKSSSSLDSVALTWTGAVPPAIGRIEGYNIYRKRKGETVYLYSLNSAPVKQSTFEDKQLEWGSRYDYVVRSVATVDGGTVESVPSNEVNGALGEPE